MNHLALSAAAGQPAKMSSREIADFVGTTHDSVLKTIRLLVKKGVVLENETPYVHQQNGQTYSPEKAGEHINHGMYADSTGRSLPLFILSKDAAPCIFLVYSG